MNRILLLLSLWAISATVSAQSARPSLLARIDSVLGQRYLAANYDTNYVVRPESHITLKLRANISGLNIHLDGTGMKGRMSTDHKATLSLGVSYKGIAASIAVNPSKWSGRYKDYELNLNAYSSRLSVDASFQASKTLAGTIDAASDSYALKRGWIDMQVLNLTGYYTFNHRRFSYPAAFTQSYLQRRSAGSWLAGISYQSSRINTTAEVPAGTPPSRIYIGHLGIGGGYGYNLVVGKKWLFHLSALPTLVIFNRNNITIDGERQKPHTRFPDMIFNEHVAIVHNFSPRYFAGATAVISNTLYNDHSTSINQNKWRVRGFLGVRL